MENCSENGNFWSRSIIKVIIKGRGEGVRKPQNPKTWLRNTWMIPKAYQKVSRPLIKVLVKGIYVGIYEMKASNCVVKDTYHVIFHKNFPRNLLRSKYAFCICAKKMSIFLVLTEKSDGVHRIFLRRFHNTV